jgi:hypothetical protein
MKGAEAMINAQNISVVPRVLVLFFPTVMEKTARANQNTADTIPIIGIEVGRTRVPA